MRRQLGRFEILAPIGSGGMASIHLARIAGPAGFEKPVALKIMGKDIRRRLRNPFSLLLLLAFPLILAVLIGLAFGSRGEAQLPRTEVLVADLDGGWVSGFMKYTLQTGYSGAPVLRTRSVGEQEGREALAAGDATALLVFPQNFTRDYLAGQCHAPRRAKFTDAECHRLAPVIL